MLGIRRVRSDRGRIWELPPDPASLNKETKQGEGDELEEFVSDDSGDPEKIIEQRELSKLITAALEDLSQKQRAIIQGVYFEEKSTAQLAEELGLTDAQQAFTCKKQSAKRIKQKRTVTAVLLFKLRRSAGNSFV